ncbi:hypothetical protein [Variovorax sp. GT1P44]|uniref:hypothetical protein n=1 Tax=Variovorax sp. GT1P44 TaxID=3443742 RepID=UPI003F44C946
MNDFAACIAIAAGTAPDAYPAWSDGYKAHFAETVRLWAEIRPQLCRDVDEAHRIDIALQKMAKAVEDGDTGNFQKFAQTLRGLDVSVLR